MGRQLTCLYLIIFCSQLFANDYPTSWWESIDESERRSWEVLPQDAGVGEVVLSKRTELGVFSNFANTPFSLDGVDYASIEGLWQMMKYPDQELTNDTRLEIGQYQYSRQEVQQLFGFEAKQAGEQANKIMKKFDIRYVSYHGQKFDYKDMGHGSELHYQILQRATWQKIKQNSKLKKLLLKTKGLKLIPDHHVGLGKPASYYYFDILMDIRSKL